MEKFKIQFQEVSFSYGKRKALQDINWQISPGKKIALLGGNGAGKSTLILLLNGLLKPNQGRLLLNETPYDYHKKSLRKLRSQVGIVFQNPDHQLVAPSVYEELSFGLVNMGLKPEIIRQKVEQALIDFDLTELQHVSPHQLSVGQKKRVCLASIMVMQPQLLICDEPGSGLDPSHNKLIFQLLDDLNQKGTTILYATHDVNQAYVWADEAVILKDGKLLCEGEVAKVLSDTAGVQSAGLDLPFLVEMSRKMMPDLPVDQLPKNLNEMCQLLNYPICVE